MDPEKTKLVDRVKLGASGGKRLVRPCLVRTGDFWLTAVLLLSRPASGPTKEVAPSRRRLGTPFAEKFLGLKKRGGLALRTHVAASQCVSNQPFTQPVWECPKS